MNPFTKKYKLQEDFPHTMTLEYLTAFPSFRQSNIKIMDGVAGGYGMSRGVWILPDPIKKCLFLLPLGYVHTQQLHSKLPQLSYCEKLGDMLSYSSKSYNNVYYLREWPYKEKISIGYNLDTRLEKFTIIPYIEEDWKD